MNTTWVDNLRLAGQLKKPHSWAVESRPGMQFIDTTYARIRLRIAGHGSPTVLFHPDPPNVIEHYDEIFDNLSAATRVVCFEAPGFGFSFPKRGFKFSFQQYFQVVEELFSKLKMEPYLLAFPCMGGLIALKLAEKYPQLIEKLILTQLSSWSEEAAWVRERDRYRILLCPIIGQVFLATFTHWAVRYWYKGGLGRDSLIPKFTNPALEALDHGSCYCLASCFQEFFKGKPVEFKPISQPTAVVWGTADRSHVHTDKRSILDVVPHATWFTLEHAGHSPLLEEPQRFCEIIHDLAGLHCKFTAPPSGSDSVSPTP